MIVSDRQDLPDTARARALGALGGGARHRPLERQASPFLTARKARLRTCACWRAASGRHPISSPSSRSTTKPLPAKAVTRCRAPIWPRSSRPWSAMEPRVVAVDLLLLDQGQGRRRRRAGAGARQTPLRHCGSRRLPRRDADAGRRRSGDPLARLPRAERFLLPLPGLRGERRGRHRQSHLRQVRHAARHTDAVSNRRQGRVVVPAACRRTRNRQRTRSSRPTGCGSLDKYIPTDIDHVLPLVISTASKARCRTISAAALVEWRRRGGIAQGPHRRDRRDRDRQRRRVFPRRSIRCLPGLRAYRGRHRAVGGR